MEGESVRKAIIAAKEQTDGRLSEIKNNVETTLQNLDSSRKESELRKAAVTAEIEKAANHLDNVLNHMENEYSSSINHVLEQQKMEIHKLEAVEKSYRDSMLQMKKNYSDAFEEIKITSEKYKEMEAEERENLCKIKELSGQMAELHAHQKTVMEYLSQLCQDSDQFMEIQKSINDMWEIMKAVWVDSLLNEYKREIESEIKPAKV